MSFLSGQPGILRQEDLTIIRNVFDRVTSEPWVSKDPAAQEQFAKYILRMYDRGMCEPEKLFRLCLLAAKHKLVDPSLISSSSQTEPDDNVEA
jgi:hypothetical protein